MHTFPYELIKTCLVFAAHPDDEVLGAGGFIRKLTKAGTKVITVYGTAGKGGREHSTNSNNEEINQQQQALSKEIDQACKALGVTNPIKLNFPDNRMDTVSKMDISIALKEIVQSEQPDLVLTHHFGDYNWDHSLIHEATLMACRCNPGEHSPSWLLSYEVLSSTERAVQASPSLFGPNLYINIENEIEDKKKALSAYESELHLFPHPRSIQGVEVLAKRRGMEIGINYAEAFQILRAKG